MKPRITKNKELYGQLCELLSNPDVYDIMVALRGPDGDGDTEEIKRLTAARLRGLFNLSDELAGAVNNEPLTMEDKKTLERGRKCVGGHYMCHYNIACFSFLCLFGYDPRKVDGS